MAKKLLFLILIILLLTVIFLEFYSKKDVKEEIKAIYKKYDIKAIDLIKTNALNESKINLMLNELKKIKEEKTGNYVKVIKETSYLLEVMKKKQKIVFEELDCNNIKKTIESIKEIISMESKIKTIALENETQGIESNLFVSKEILEEELINLNKIINNLESNLRVCV